ncbi:hypothetical protein BG006_003456 [Podila minutissima]|uniref:Secreted protein n=1 Tax=Podila minutissima TaxID=64525 RepID=A0A9P5SRE8_9FUNG|nr:hypothetical protein BG006_003456 [Podila minutissima]
MKLIIVLTLLSVATFVSADDPRTPEDICIEYSHQHGLSFERASKHGDCSAFCEFCDGPAQFATSSNTASTTTTVEFGT